MATSDSTTKTCKTCGGIFPANTDNFYRASVNKDGLNRACKSCANADHLKYTHGFRKTEILPDGQKRCTKCKQIFPSTTDYFYRKSSTATKLTSQCKSCVNKHQAEYVKANEQEIIQRRKLRYRDNPFPLREKARRWTQNNRERKQATDKVYRQNNRERLREYFRNYPRDLEKERQRNREYDRRFPENKKRKSNKRRAIKAQAQGSHTASELRVLFEMQCERCAYCGIPISYSIHRDVHADHITPLSRGGADSIENIALACSLCNLSKGGKTLEEWEARRGW